LKIFLGSSSEAAKQMKRIANWLPADTAVRWDEIGAFEPGHYAFEELLRHARTVDGAILVFAEDDASKIRGKKWWTTRDNVWLEYGLFVGSLGHNRVMPVVVGNPKWASDLLGITQIQLPRDFKAGSKKTKRAKFEIKKWAKELSPVFLRRQAFDVGADRAPSETSLVEHILTTTATKFLKENTSSEIRALCSDKGKLGKSYYRGQFDWVRKGAKKRPRRKLRRVFVGRKAPKRRFGVEFAKGELKGIRMHLKEQARGSRIKVKWVYEDNDVLGAEYRDSLGFALFGEKWFVHWGLESGYYYQEEKDKAFGEHLAERFDKLWRGAQRFDKAMTSFYLRP
jgi:hypothetical protein